MSCNLERSFLWLQEALLSCCKACGFGLHACTSGSNKPVLVSLRVEALLPGAPSLLVTEAEMDAKGRARLLDVVWGSSQDAGMEAPSRDVKPTILIACRRTDLSWMLRQASVRWVWDETPPDHSCLDPLCGGAPSF